jgi:hypothetical protein
MQQHQILQPPPPPLLLLLLLLLLPPPLLLLLRCLPCFAILQQLCSKDIAMQPTCLPSWISYQCRYCGSCALYLAS